MNRHRFFLSVLFLAALAPPALATLVRPVDLAELTRAAEQIVVGDVLTVSSAWDEDHRTITTTVEMGVQETWKGSVPSDGKLIVRHLGGSVGDIEMAVLGEANFTVGERALVFLRGARPVDMAQGKRHLRWEGAAKRWIAAPTDLRGARAVPVPGTSNAAQAMGMEEDLDSLRAKVRALIGK
jgi:hypothetical protein